MPTIKKLSPASQKSARELSVVKEIEKKFGSVIDLKKSPGLIIEIIRAYKNKLGDIGGGPGGVDPGVSTIAVGIDAGTGGGGGVKPSGGIEQIGFDKIRNTDLLKEILNLKKEISNLNKKMGK